MKRMQKAEECWADKNNVTVANCLLLSSSSSSSSSSSFAHYRVPIMLYSKTPTNKTKLNVQAQAAAAHSMLAAAADSCLRILHSPFLNKLLSLPTHFHNFSKVEVKKVKYFSELTLEWGLLSYSLRPYFSMQKENSKKVFFVSNHNFAAILPGDSVAGIVVANGILNFLNIYNTLLIVRLVLTWFPNSPPAIVSPLSTLCDPYLNIFRGIIPPLGGTLDLSPILAFLVLNAFTSTAAALPAELPPTVKSKIHQISSSNLTSSQQKWTRRLFQSKAKNSGGDN